MGKKGQQGVKYNLGHCILHVAQAATDVLEVSNEAIERQVTSEVEGTLLQYNTPIERQVLCTEQ